MMAMAALFLALFPANLFASNMLASLGDFYISAKGGWANPGKMNDNTSYYLTDIEIDSNPGFHMSGAFGEIKGAWRGEIELAMQKNDLYQWTRTNTNGATSKEIVGDVKIFTALGNIYYDFKGIPKWTPYVGAGAGGVLVDMGSVKYASGSTYVAGEANAVARGIACQATFGVSYEITDQFVWDMGYRFLWLMDSEFKAFPALEISSHNVTMGLRYLF